jgi:hypothetical protein
MELINNPPRAQTRRTSTKRSVIVWCQAIRNPLAGFTLTSRSALSQGLLEHEHPAAIETLRVKPCASDSHLYSAPALIQS